MQIGFLGILTIIFVLAKLLGWITWSWWVVFSPVFLGIAAGVGFLVFFFVVWIAGFVAVLRK